MDNLNGNHTTNTRRVVAWFLVVALGLAFVYQVLLFAGSSGSRVFGLLPYLGGDQHLVTVPSWECHVDVSADPVGRVLSRHEAPGDPAREGHTIFRVNFIGDARFVDGLFAPTTIRKSMNVTIWSVPGGPINPPQEMNIARSAAIKVAQAESALKRSFLTSKLASCPIPADGEIRDEWKTPWTPGYWYNASLAACLLGGVLAMWWALGFRRPSGTA